jgi:hypothetical protein
MRAYGWALVASIVSLQSTLALAQASRPEPHFPGAVWERKQPAEVGLNAQLLKEAVDFAIASETSAPRDLKLNHSATPSGRSRIAVTRPA